MRENTIDPIRHTHANPADGPPPRSWLDRGTARLAALAIALVLGVLLVFSLGDEVMALIRPDASPATEEAGADVVEDPAVQACLDERIGHIDQMVTDGVLDGAQREGWVTRAAALCINQPSSAPGVRAPL